MICAKVCEQTMPYSVVAGRQKTSTSNVASECAFFFILPALQRHASTIRPANLLQRQKCLLTLAMDDCSSSMRFLAEYRCCLLNA